MINVQGIRRNMKNVVRNYSDAQVKVREATSNDPWGPSGTLMSEIADLTYNVVAFSEIMQVVWKRLNDHGKNWKHVYKALVLLDYLIKTGSEKVTQQCKENIYAIQTLRDFQYFEDSKDQGVNVREKAKQLVALLKDDDRLKNERARALKARERFARSSSNMKQDPLPRRIDSSDLSQGSLDDEMMSPGAHFELETARPQTIGEEELQLQLALAMSREEADQAERLKRNDDLRLQMALSESEEEFKRKPSDAASSSSAVDDLLGLSMPSNDNKRTPLMDPWGMPITCSNMTPEDDIWSPTSMAEQNHNSVRNDAWSPSMENAENIDAFSALQGDYAGNAFDMSSMKKSMSVDVCAKKEGPKSLESLLGPDSSLIQLDGMSVNRSRNAGNPFHALRPSPQTMNSMRGNQGSPFQDQQQGALPSSTSVPYSLSQNPFM